MDKKIVKEYQEGKSISQLLREYPNYSRHRIDKLLFENNVSIRGGRKRLEFSEEEMEKIKKLIDDGAFLFEIAEKMGCSKGALKKRMDEHGLSLKNNNRVNRNIKSDYFSNIDTPEKAYWLGFLFTDGSVDKPKSKGKNKVQGRIRLQLQERDLEILEKFKEDLGITSKIIYDIRPNSTCCSVEFVDEQIFQDLGKYGIVPRKTYVTEHIPYEKIPEHLLPSFALGLFDGDGSLCCCNNDPMQSSINFTSYHKSIAEDFQKIIDKLIEKDKKNTVYFTSAWHVAWSGRRQVTKILDILYRDSSRYLKRKHDIYLNIKKV